MLFILFPFALVAQEIYTYEDKIGNRERFNSKEVEFINPTDSVRLSGTLLFPKVEFNKLIIIVPGSGKDTRHSHFLLAEKLLENTIGVFRFDERGVGKSEGRLSYGFTKLSSDLFYVISYLKNIGELEGKKIGVIGHSLGGFASIDAYANEAPIDFLIQWAAPVKKHSAFVKHQIEVDNKLFKGIKAESKEDKIKLVDLVHSLILENEEDNAHEIYKKARKKFKKEYGFKKSQYEDYIMPFVLETVKKDYEATYKNLNIPTLYVIGSEDRFVSPENSLGLLNSFNNKNITVKKFEGLNHYLNKQKLTSMSKDVYDLDSSVLETIITWVNSID